MDPLGDFARRHLGLRPEDRAALCGALGVASPQELMALALPGSVRDGALLPLGPALDEPQVLARLRELADMNRPRTSLIGAGYYDTHTPAVIQRQILENPSWYTAYTPYQPEISQGRLEMLLAFQTMVTDLTGLELANASLLDEATAAAEAMTMCLRLSANAAGDARRFVVDADTHPQTIAVLTTRAEPMGIVLDVVPHLVKQASSVVSQECFGVFISNPSSTGAVRDIGELVTRAHSVGALCVVATDLLACVATRPPGEMGADMAVGSAQRFGVPMFYGGPHAGFLACRTEHARALPGRLVGVSTDTQGRPALRLALQTREQHIRRERATSNVCTAQALLAVVAAAYAMWHGPEGLGAIARRVHHLTVGLADQLAHQGWHLRHAQVFDTLCVETPGRAMAVHEAARRRGLDLRHLGADAVGLSLDETTTAEVVATVLEIFGEVETPPRHDGPPTVTPLPDALRRHTEVLPHETFRRCRSEHEMLRELRRLSDRDLALDRTMIPLGSCTMKLNAAVEMTPVTWPAFARLHPHAPDDETVGTRTLIGELEQALATITGYDRVSLQPNAGSQGEFAGLLAIRGYHRSRGESQRTICLVPTSAHGTNAASAVMTGFSVVPVATDERGDVDVADLRRRIDEAGERLGAIMITYPSTHGVFEPRVADVCAMVHDAGGQVYVDGANLNALVGWARPGAFGADVGHLNLHKTFCIPHGGGGPGVGPVGVRAHLAPFLPGDPLAPAGSSPVGAVSAARFGSPGVLPIAWAFIALMGAEGLRAATADAVLAANYLAHRLDASFPVLYRGEHGVVAHEVIVDLRPLTKSTGVTVDDVAKRLIDHGFHAPTVSFPVAGTLMIEPTESESLAELDRFVEAMASIRGEIDAVAAGVWSIEDSPLRHAPHTAADLLGEWNRAYDRWRGAYPGGVARPDKYFPPVSRIDAARGDRHLMCSCASLEELVQASGG